MPRAYLLVVDDEPAILTTLQKALTLEGYHVDVAGGVAIAEEKFKKRAYDLCLFDVMLPDGDGVELLRKLREAGAEVPVIMMSGHATIDLAVRATRSGALQFLEKPLNTDALLLTIETALRLDRAETEAKALRSSQGELVGNSPSMVKLIDQLGRAARGTADVLVIGERGTGKELVSRMIHERSTRARGPFEKLNCAAVPQELIESELFGHEAGAFTGASKQRRGKFERASGGTLFLDEVGDMAVPMQAKLLRVLQEREVERVGGNETVKVDVRVVAATNRDLAGAAAKGDFRADLYDRLNVIPLVVPALRERRTDIPLLAAHLLASSVRANDSPGKQLSQAAVDALCSYEFPGNVRELRNVIERLVILTPHDEVNAEDVRAALPGESSRGGGHLFRPGVSFRVLVEDAERRILGEALAHFGGQMTATARALELERSHLYKKARSLGLREKSSGDGDE